MLEYFTTLVTSSPRRVSTGLRPTTYGATGDPRILAFLPSSHMGRPMYLRTGPKFVLVVLVNFWVRERVEDF